MILRSKESNFYLKELVSYIFYLNLCVVISFFSYWHFFLEIEEIITVTFFSLSIIKLFTEHKNKHFFYLELSVLEIIYLLSGIAVTLLQLIAGVKIGLFNIFYYLFYGAVLFYLKTYFKDNRRRLILLNALTILPIILFIEYILVNQFHYIKTSLGNHFLKNPGIIGNCSAVLLPFISLSVARPEIGHFFFTKGVSRVIAYLSFSIIFFTLIFSQARAAWIGIACATLCILCVHKKSWLSALFHNIKRKIKIRNQISTIGLSTAVIFILLIIIHKFIIILLTIKINSAIGRIHVYKICLACIKKFYLVGCGIGNSKIFLNRLQAAYFATPRPLKEQLLANNLFECFNSFFQTTIEGGILLSIAYITAIYYFVRALIKIMRTKRRFLATEGAASVIAIFIASMLSNPFNYNITLTLFILSLSIISFPSTQIRLGKQYLYPIYFLIASSFFIAERRLITMYKWHDTLSKMQNGYSEVALKQYQLLIPALKDNGFFLFNYGAELYNHKKYQESSEKLELATRYYSSYELYCYLGNSYEARGLYKRAENAYIEACNISPHMIYPKFLLFKLYKRAKMKKRIIETGELIVRYPLKIQNPTAIQMKEEVNYNLNQLGYDSIDSRRHNKSF